MYIMFLRLLRGVHICHSYVSMCVCTCVCVVMSTHVHAPSFFYFFFLGQTWGLLYERCLWTGH